MLIAMSSRMRDEFVMISDLVLIELPSGIENGIVSINYPPSVYTLSPFTVPVSVSDQSMVFMQFLNNIPISSVVTS